MPRTRTSTGTVHVLHPANPLPAVAVADGYNPAVPLDEIDPNPSNVRRDLGDLVELTTSIVAVGVRHPITVTPFPTGDVTKDATTTGHRYLLVDGHRRYAAAATAGMTTIPAIVRTDLTGEADFLTEMLRAGLLQQQLSPIEEATAYAQLELLGLKPAEIARRVGRSRTTVEQRLHLMDLPEAVRERVHTRAITLDEAAVIAEFADLVEAWPAARDWVRTLEDAAGGKDWSFTVNRARSAWDGERKRQTARAQIAALGVRLVKDADVNGSPWSYVRASWYSAEELADAGSDHGDTTLNGVSAEAQAHSSCPGAAGLVSPGGYVTWFCLQSQLHGQQPMPGSASTVPGKAFDPWDGQPAPATAVPYVDLGDVDPAVTRLRLLRRWTTHETAACAAASMARQEWISDVLLPGRKPLAVAQSAELARYVAITSVGYAMEPSHERWLEQLHPDDDTLDALDPDAAEERLLAELLAHRDPQRALLAGLATEEERTSSAPAYWIRPEGPQPIVRSWLRLLQALGYEPCSWEAEYLADPTGACRVCGCTEDNACTDAEPIGLSACWWVVPDLCSSCASRALTAAQEDGAGG